LQGVQGLAVKDIYRVETIGGQPPSYVCILVPPPKFLLTLHISYRCSVFLGKTRLLACPIWLITVCEIIQRAIVRVLICWNAQGFTSERGLVCDFLFLLFFLFLPILSCSSVLSNSAVRRSIRSFTWSSYQQILFYFPFSFFAWVFEAAGPALLYRLQALRRQPVSVYVSACLDLSPHPSCEFLLHLQKLQEPKATALLFARTRLPRTEILCMLRILLALYGPFSHVSTHHARSMTRPRE
jgi:hypothetical protein